MSFHLLSFFLTLIIFLYVSSPAPPPLPPHTRKHKPPKGRGHLLVLYFFKHLKQSYEGGMDAWRETKFLWKRLYLSDLWISQHLIQITPNFCWINKRINHEHWFEATKNLRLPKGYNILTFSNFPLHEKKTITWPTCRHFSVSFQLCSSGENSSKEGVREVDQKPLSLFNEIFLKIYFSILYNIKNSRKILLLFLHRRTFYSYRLFKSIYLFKVFTF